MGRSMSIWAVCLTLILAGFSYNSEPVVKEKEEFKIVESESLSVYVDSDEDLRFFLKAEYSENEEEINFLTRESTTQIRIYNDLESMVYLLPIDSDRITLSRNLFDKGEYIFNFDTESDRKMYKTNVFVR